MKEADVRERVWTFVVENFLYMRPTFKVGPDDSLLGRGVFDSLGILDVIGFLEDSFGIKVEQQEITAANFDTLNAIARFVVAKLDGAPPAAH